MSNLLPRRASEQAIRRLKAARGLVINGPRQSGKTALMSLLNEANNGTYLSLDQPSNLQLAESDPTGLVTGFARPLYIDEVQRAGNPLLLAIKHQLDLSNDKGQFVLAGSTRFLTEPRISESLAGRVRFIDLWPLSQGEIDGKPDGFVDVVLQTPEALGDLRERGLSRREVFERVCRGGFPEAVLSDNDENRRDFFASYVRTITTKDITELADLGHRDNIRDIVRLLAARTACELNVSELGRELQLPASTLTRYLPLLETVYAHYSIPAWSRNLTAKVVKRPKVHFTDSGVAAYLLGVDVDALSLPTSQIAGALLETFIAGELARQLTWARADASMFHWRDRDGNEVDLLLEASNGNIAAIEVKAAVDVSDRDFKGIRALQSRVGDRFVSGTVLHCGDIPRTFGPNLTAVPINWLWDVVHTA